MYLFCFIIKIARLHVPELSILVNTLLTFPRMFSLLKQKQAQLNIVEKSQIGHWVKK